MLWESRDDFEICNTIFIWVMWIVQINFEVNWRYHDSSKSNERNELVNLINTNAYIVWSHHQSTRNFNYRDRRVFTQKLIEKFLRNSNIIHQSSKCIKSIYCEWSDCSINDFENVKHSFSEVSTYSIVRIAERLIIVWHVKWVYACHMNVSKAIMTRRECHTSALINRGIWRRFEAFESDLVISNEFRM